MFVLLLLTVAGGAIAGVPGALGGYLAALLLSALIPGLAGGAECEVPPAEDETLTAEDGDRDAA